MSLCVLYFSSCLPCAKCSMSKCIFDITLFIILYSFYRKSLVFSNQSQRNLTVTWTPNGPNIFTRYTVSQVLSVCKQSEGVWEDMSQHSKPGFKNSFLKVSWLPSFSVPLSLAVLSVLFRPRLLVAEPGLPLRGCCLTGWYKARLGSGTQNKGGASECMKSDWILSFDTFTGVQKLVNTWM